MAKVEWYYIGEYTSIDAGFIVVLARLTRCRVTDLRAEQYDSRGKPTIYLWINIILKSNAKHLKEGAA